MLNKYLKSELIKYNDDIHQQIYNIVHYLARYSVWEETYSDEFKNGILFPEWLILMCGDKINNLYYFLRKNADYNIIKNNFKMFKEILEDINK